MLNVILHDNLYEIQGAYVDLTDLKPLQVCIFHVTKLTQMEKYKDYIRNAISRSKKVVIGMPADVARHPDLREHLSMFPGLYAISVRYKLEAQPDFKLAGFVVNGQEGDLAVLHQHCQLVESYSFAETNALQIIPEIEISSSLDLLGPTLMSLSRSQPPWMVLAVWTPPTPERVKILKETFHYLQIRSFPMIDIHFSFHYPLSKNWRAQTENFFSGPDEFHIDLSNKCTHSCVFCALYAPAIIEDYKSKNQFDDAMKRFMSATLEPNKALEIIQSLPITTKLIQFGGAGDPMLHPKAFELIAHARERAFGIEILSNMEYFKEGDHERLTELGGLVNCSIKFIANISGATPETYVMTRPRQKPATFHKVIETLRKFTELRKKNNGRGVHFVLMCVVTRLNFHEASKLVDLAKEVGAEALWLKPLEIHHRAHYDLLPKPNERSDYLKSLRAAIARADKLQMNLLDRGFLEETIVKFAEGQPCN